MLNDSSGSLVAPDSRTRAAGPRTVARRPAFIGVVQADSGHRNPEGDLFTRPGHESLTLAFCLATRRHELGTFLLIGLDAFVQQHLADLDSVGRHCATRVHKLGARYPIPLKTNAGDNGRIGGSHGRARVESKSSMAAICACFHHRGT